MSLLAPRDAARRLNLSQSRLVQLDREGVFRAQRDSAGRRIYDEMAVEAFKHEREQRRAPVTTAPPAAGVLALVVAAVLSLASPASAAIAFENHTGSAKVTSASTIGPSFSVTCDGSAGEKLIVVIGQQNATASVTFNGVGMTEVPTDSPATDGGYYLRMFTLDSPASGAHTVAVTWGAPIVGQAIGACYSGVATGLDSHSKASTSGTPAATQTPATTVVASNSWLVMGSVTSVGPTDPSASTGATRRAAISDANTIALALFDSNGAVGTGSQGMTVDAGAPAFIASVIVSIAPSGGAPTPCPRTMLLMGVGCDD